MDDIENPNEPLPSPRAARFGEGPEGRGVRHERGLSGPRDSFPERVAKFLRDVRSEMKRVSWPTFLEVKNTTLITLVAVIFFAIYLFVVDHIWVYLLTGLSRVLNWMTGA